MSKPLKIIIFDGSFKTTSFINRLAKGLAVKHKIYILGFNESLFRKLENVHYISLGSNQNILSFAFTSLNRVFRANKHQLLFPTIKLLIKGERQLLQQQNLQLAIQEITPDIIHLQWPSVIRWVEEMLLQQTIPIVLSQRGFHNNVRPFVDTDNFEYLKKWYPKMSGFHSVSKAISINGDKIWTSLTKIDEVVYTGLDLGELPFSKTYTKHNPIRLISIGRAHWIKGYDYALQSCKLLKEKQISFQYTIIGGAGDEELQFLVHDLGLQEEVILQKRLPQHEVFKMMQSSSALLMSSIEEGMPNVIVEAMALGLPVISTDCGGVPELITHGQEGWLVPTRDPEAMAEAIISFSELSLETVESIRLAARKKVEQQHNEKQMIEGMENLYYKVLPPTINNNQ